MATEGLEEDETEASSESFSGFRLAPGEAKCFSHLWVVMKTAGRQPTWKAPGLGWERKGSNELTSIRLHSHADPLAHTNVDGGQHLDFIPWHIIPLLSWNRGTTQGDQLIEMTLNRWERILCFLEE